MSDPFDRANWPYSPLAAEFEDLVTGGASHGAADAVVAWACEHLGQGTAPGELCDAALWVGLRNTRTEGTGPSADVSHAVLGANAANSIGTGQVAALGAVQHCVLTGSATSRGVNDPRVGPFRLGWIEASGTGDRSSDPVDALLDATSQGEPELSDHRWIEAAATDPEAAEDALVSSGAAAYHLSELKLIYPCELRAWVGLDSPVDPVLFRAAARFAGNQLQDPDAAMSRRADAAALAETAGRDPAAGDLDRISMVATGIARTPRGAVEPLVIGSLQDGLHPADLVWAVALVGAARFADTSFDDAGPGVAVRACNGTHAVRRCLERTVSAALRYELALCSLWSPNTAALAPLAELTVPPSDDGALDDLRAAIADGDPDAAADAASAVPPDDAGSTATAWRVVAAAAATDQWMELDAMHHVVAMREDFRGSDHPARIWFLAAAARTAAHAVAREQPVADAVNTLIG